MYTLEIPLAEQETASLMMMMMMMVMACVDRNM